MACESFCPHGVGDDGQVFYRCLHMEVGPRGAGGPILGPAD